MDSNPGLKVVFAPYDQDLPLHGETASTTAAGWTVIGSELSSPNFNSSVRAE